LESAALTRYHYRKYLPLSAASPVAWAASVLGGDAERMVWRTWCWGGAGEPRPPGSRASRGPRICPVIPYSPPPGAAGTVNPQARAVCACDWSCGTAALPLQASAEGQVTQGLPCLQDGRS